MDLLTYFTRSIIVLVAFTLLYLLAFRKDSHFTLYRIFLLLGLIAAMFLPFIEINYTVWIEPFKSNDIFKEVETPLTVSNNVADVTTKAFNWFSLVYWIYFAGLFVFVSRFFVEAIQVIRIMRKSTRKEADGITYYVGKDISEPFTFGTFIFLDEESFHNKFSSDIVAHEKIHLKQNHWLDVVLCELLIAIQWFNPLAWYYGRLVKQNLEFLADRGVLEQGYIIENYIQSIICVTMGAEASVLANHFRFSQNKRRLKMMKNVRKSKWRQLKLLLTLPLIGGFLWAFSQPNYQLRPNDEQNVVESVMKDVKKITITGQVGVEDTMEIMDPNTGQYKRMILLSPVPGVSIVLKGKTIGCVSDMDGKFTIEATEDDLMVFSFVGFKTEERRVEEGKELIVSLKPTSYELDPAPFRKDFKGKVTPPPPPPPPPVVKEEKIAPPPPPPPAENDEPVFFIVEDLPKYKSGIVDYFSSLYSNIELEKAKQNLKGTVKVKFTVDTKGNVINVEAMGQKGKEAEVAEKIVSNLNNWQPGKQRGKPVSCSMIVPVEFE
nr:M56 family metallopeptidase [uncultured Carboxylicivirga sp.]